MISRSLFTTGLAALAVAACGFAAGTASAQTTLIDTGTNATNFSIATTPHTYMGDAFTNNNLPAGTTQFQVTGGTVYLASQAAVTYTDIQLRITLWNTVDPTSTTAVFSNPAANLTVDFGGGTLAANSVYTLPFTFSGNFPTLTGGSGHNFGITINFQDTTTAGGTLADDTNLSPALVYNTSTTTPGYAAGTITTGTSPNFGYYRNVEGQTNFNFIAGDQRTISQAYEGIGFRLNGNAIVPEPSAYACVGVFALLAGGAYVRRRRLAAV